MGILTKLQNLFNFVTGGIIAITVGVFMLRATMGIWDNKYSKKKKNKENNYDPNNRNLDIVEMIVSHTWLQDHLYDPQLVLIDARPKIAYTYGHIPNSVSLTVEQVIKLNQFGANLVPDEQYIADVFGSLGIDQTKTVIVCGEYMDPSVARIAWTLLYFGHEKTQMLDIGISRWQQMGLEFTRKPATTTLSSFIPKVNHGLRIEADDLENKIENVTLLDARSPQEYLGGHLPHSILMPFTDGVGIDGMLYKEKNSLGKLFEQKLIPKNNEIVCYCTHGHRAANLFFQLKIAGYENVALYDGSFIDWYGRKLSLE